MKDGSQKDQDILELIDLMHTFANEKHQHFGKIWTEFDGRAFAFGMIVGAFLFLFQQFVAFGRS